MLSPVRAAQVAASRLGRSNELPAFAATVGGLALAVVCAVAGLEIATLVLLLVSVVGEMFFEKKSSAAGMLLRHAAFGVPMRFALRLVVGLVATEQIDSIAAWQTLAAVGIAETLVLCARALHETYREIGPLKPMRTRNIPGDTRIHDAPPRRVVEVVASQLLVLVPAQVHAHLAGRHVSGRAFASVVLAVLTLLGAAPCPPGALGPQDLERNEAEESLRARVFEDAS